MVLSKDLRRLRRRCGNVNLHKLRPNAPAKSIRCVKRRTNQARKKSTKIKFLGPETARWGGDLPRDVKGWWPKTSCPPSKLCLPWVSKRGIRDVPGILPGCPGPLAVFKKFVQKNFVCIFRSHTSEAKNQPKEEVFGRTSLRTSGQKLRSGPPNLGKKTSILARTYTQKLRSEKLRADFGRDLFCWSLDVKACQAVNVDRCTN